MTTTEVAFARSTWRHAQEFSQGLSELARLMPMELVRLYVIEGVRTPRIPLGYYDRIDELRELRRKALLGEMRHVEAQAELWLEEHRAEAHRIAAKAGRTEATPEMLLGADVVRGESPVFGFAPETYVIAPSLRVYELFMWFDENERWTQN